MRVGAVAERFPLRGGERVALHLFDQPGPEPGERRQRCERPHVVDVASQLVDNLLDELVAEVHTGQPRLGRRDGVEDRGVGAVDRGLTLEQIAGGRRRARG